MAFQPVEYEFPDPEKAEKDSFEIELEPSSAEPMQKPDKAKKEEPVETLKADDLEVEVVDDTPKADRGRKPSEPPEDVTEEELQDYSEKVRRRIQHFSKGYHDERRAKEQALRERQELERLAQQLVEENKQLKGSVTKNQTVLIEQARRSAAAELEMAKRTYRQAYESGEADAVLDAQDKLTNARLKLERVNNIKLPALQEKEVPVETQQQQQVYNAPAPQVDTKAQEWQQANPWFGTDDEMTSFALGLHSKLVKSGVDPQSDEYYETINSRMRSIFPDNFEDTSLEEVEEEKPKRRANVVAPATRSTAPKKVRLTQTQVAIAKRLGVPLELYAKKVAEEMRKANG
jgi:hypothetical protein